MNRIFPALLGLVFLSSAALAQTTPSHLETVNQYRLGNDFAQGLIIGVAEAVSIELLLDNRYCGPNISRLAIADRIIGQAEQVPINDDNRAVPMMVFYAMAHVELECR